MEHDREKEAHNCWSERRSYEEGINQNPQSSRRIKSSRSNTIRLGSAYRIANEDAIADREDITIQVVVDQMHVVVIRQWSARPLDGAGEVAVRRREWVLPNLKILWVSSEDGRELRKSQPFGIEAG